MRHSIRIIASVCAAVQCAAHVASALDSDETANTVSQRASGKFGRGVVNLTTGWGELIRCPVEITREQGRLLGATWGPLKGIAMTVIRTASGAFETVLFFYPLPGNYDPFLEPEYVWPGDVFIKHRHPEAADA